MRVPFQHALEVGEELRQARGAEVGGTTLRFLPLFLVVEAAADRMVAVVNFAEQVGNGQLQLVSPASSGRVGGRQAQPRSEKLQDVGRLADQLPAGLEVGWRIRRVPVFRANSRVRRSSSRSPIDVMRAARPAATCGAAVVTALPR